MAEIRVLIKRLVPLKLGGLHLITDDGRSIAMKGTGDSWGYTSNAIFGTIDRQGKKAVTRKTASGLRTHTFEQLIQHLDWEQSVEADIRQYTDLSGAGVRIRFAGGSPSFQQGCWWYIQSIDVDVQRINYNGHPCRAVLKWDLIEQVDTHAVVSVHRPPPPPPPPPAAAPPPARTHTVVRGDTLWGLAAKYLGNGARWPEIHRLNTDKIRNPHWIYPGQVFRIP